MPTLPRCSRPWAAAGGIEHPEISMRKIETIMASALLLLSGCAATGKISDAEWQQGARRGWVIRHYAPDQPAASLPACLAALPAGEYAAHRYVKVRYVVTRLAREAVAEVPAGMALKDGEQLKLWPADCAAGQLACIGDADCQGRRMVNTAPPPG
jgi:hypothetical protein